MLGGPRGGLPQVAYCALRARQSDRRCPKSLLNTTEELALTELLLVDHFRRQRQSVTQLVADEDSWFSLVLETHRRIRASRLLPSSTGPDATAVIPPSTQAFQQPSRTASDEPSSTPPPASTATPPMGLLDDDAFADVLRRYGERLRSMRSMDIADVVLRTETAQRVTMAGGKAGGVAGDDLLVIDITETDVDRRLLQALMVGRVLHGAQLEEVARSRCVPLLWRCC